MIEPEQAQEYSKRAIYQYLKSCDCKTKQDFTNALTKLVSVASHYMVDTAGKKETVFRLYDIAAMIVDNPNVSEGALPKIH